jgi:hypothetical protein
MAAKSKKGSAFERRTCKDLSMWFTNGERDDVFWRTAGSGARATVRAKQGKMTADSAGDICAIDECGKPLTRLAVFELKKGYTGKSPSSRISVLQFIDSLPSEKPPLIEQWMIKLRKECTTHDRPYGFIIFERDRKKAVICMRRETFEYVKLRNPNEFKWPPFGPFCTIYGKKSELVFFLLEDFLNWCPPECLTNQRKQTNDNQTRNERQIKRRSKNGIARRRDTSMECTKTKGKRILRVSRKRVESKKKDRTITRRRKK